MRELHFPARKSVIVVVEDDSELVAILHMMLEDGEFNVRCASIGSQLFAGLEEHKADFTF
jgi:DNA-binding NtrC family response regulator